MSARHERGAVSNALRYARVARALDLGHPRRKVKEVIKHRLSKKGFIAENGRFRLAELRGAFAQLFSDGFEDLRLNELALNSDIAQTCVRALSRDDRTIHPVYLILLDWVSPCVRLVVASEFS